MRNRTHVRITIARILFRSFVTNTRDRVASPFCCRRRFTVLLASAISSSATLSCATPLLSAPDAISSSAKRTSKRRSARFAQVQFASERIFPDASGRLGTPGSGLNMCVRGSCEKSVWHGRRELNIVRFPRGIRLPFYSDLLDLRRRVIGISAESSRLRHAAPHITRRNFIPVLSFHAFYSQKLLYIIHKVSYW